MTLATPTRRMPQPDAVREFLSDLLGREVEARVGSDFDFDDEAATLLTGVLIEDTEAIAGLVVSDLPFSAYAGASLVMIPAAAATDAVKAAELTDGLRENYYEVANIMTGLLNGPTVPHLRIKDLQDGVPPDARDHILKASGRRTYEISIPGYGDGTVALYAE